ncbi:MAG: AAA family ATPase, partial [Myxococcota bacterium]
MISHLMVRNLALVDQISLDFEPGLNVLTGETGAGKSVLVGALSLILGARAHADTVRQGASEGVVEALFDGLEPDAVHRLGELGVNASDGQLLIRRTVSRGGRGRVMINGQLATVSMLAKAMAGVLDITSQHEHVGLLDPDTHQEALDAYGGLESKRDRVTDAYNRARTTEVALETLVAEERTQRARADELRRAIEAIDDAAPQPGEVEHLLAELHRLRHQHELESGVRSAEETLYSGEGAVIETVAQIHRTLERLSGLDEDLSPCVALMGSVAAELDDLGHSLSRYQHRIDVDPHRIEAAEDRLQVLRGLMRRHGGDLEAVLAARDEMAETLSGLATAQARRETLEAQLVEDRAALRSACTVLTRGRKKIREALANAIQRELADLSMDKARIHVGMKTIDPPGPNGAESVQMQISANEGEPLRSLRRVASGGEMSRLLLALKNVLAHRNQTGTYVFDEIDT